jgi:hypothetical protein
MTVWMVVAVAVVAVLLALWPPTPRSLARLGKRLASYVRVLPKAKRNRTYVMGWLGRRPSLLAANQAYETAALLVNGTDTRLKYLAGLKASALAGCPF